LGGKESEESVSTVQEALKRYVEIQEEVAKLESEKKRWRDVLVSHMQATGQSMWTPTLDTKQLTVRYYPKTTVKYDEALLQQRLGDKYIQILEPDVAKIKAHLTEVTPLLAPLLPQVGSPTREKVKAAVEAGAVERHAFDGAFTKTDSSVFSVGRTSTQK
jgi:hypothetical protein